jgi:hypothetical protein
MSGLAQLTPGSLEEELTGVGAKAASSAASKTVRLILLGVAVDLSPVCYLKRCESLKYLMK